MVEHLSYNRFKNIQVVFLVLSLYGEINMHQLKKYAKFI